MSSNKDMLKSDIIITGVGGQGAVLASKILAQAGMAAGLQVRTSETIGMAQREGSVVSQVRIGREIFSPLIADGQADILLSFELAETVRCIPKLKKAALIIVCEQCIVPVTVMLGQSSYDRDAIKQYLDNAGCQVYYLPADKLARNAGSIKAVNVVMLGALSACDGLPFDGELLRQTMERTVPKKTLAVNRCAFEAGRQKIVDIIAGRDK